MAATDVFFIIINKTLLCIVDYYSKFPIIKKADSLAVDGLVKAVKIAFVEFGLPMKIISDAGVNCTLDIQTILQTDEHRADHGNILSPPEQCSS